MQEMQDKINRDWEAYKEYALRESKEAIFEKARYHAIAQMWAEFFTEDSGQHFNDWMFDICLRGEAGLPYIKEALLGTTNIIYSLTNWTLLTTEDWLPEYNCSDFGSSLFEYTINHKSTHDDITEGGNLK